MKITLQELALQTVMSELAPLLLKATHRPIQCLSHSADDQWISQSAPLGLCQPIDPKDAPMHAEWPSVKDLQALIYSLAGLIAHCGARPTEVEMCRSGAFFLLQVRVEPRP